MPLALSISPHGHPFLETTTDESAAALTQAAESRITTAFAQSPAHGLLHLATVELQSPLPPSFDFARDLARAYLTKLSHTSGADSADLTPIPPPAPDELAA